MAVSQMVLFIALQASLVAAKNTRFQQWFPTYGPDFEAIRSSQCVKPYQSYLNGTGYLNKACPAVIDCILSNTRESYKSNMGNASVLLGLAPTLLTMLGCGTAELALLSTRRPILSFCLATGSPSVTPIRTFEYSSPFAILQSKTGRLQRSGESCVRKTSVVMVEYLLVFAAIANVATISYDLGAKSLFSFACNQSYLALLWAFLAWPVQVFGCVAFRLRYHVEKRGENYKRGLFARWLQKLRNEFSPCSTLSQSSILWKRETAFFLGWSWFTSALPASHILFGTLAFSSLLFIAVRDAVWITARYMASAILCWAILMYELSGMRQTTVIEEEQGHNRLGSGSTTESLVLSRILLSMRLGLSLTMSYFP